MSAFKVTPSMTGNDVASRRLERARQKIRDLLAGGPVPVQLWSPI